jgi:hypothetical protein
MNSITQKLDQFGWDEWFDLKAKEIDLSGHRLARVVAVDTSVLLKTDPKIVLKSISTSPCKLRKLRQNFGNLNLTIIPETDLRCPYGYYLSYHMGTKRR